MLSIRKLSTLFLKILILLISFFSAFSNYLVLAEEKPIASSIISSNSVNLRSAPSLSASIITTLNQGQHITFLGIDGNWIKVSLDNNQIGWVYRDYVSTKNINSSETPAVNPQRVSQLLSYARSLLNSRYRFGGITPNGFDCSGFTMHVYSKLGYSLPHHALAQSSLGREIERTSLQLGDLVFFKTQGATHINHVGIYIGNGNFIHASSGSGYVRINSLLSGYYLNCYDTARRILSIKY